ncbi:MAG TPA: IS256 family transposase [Sedimentisphaerales bacterium]|mgnify:FL=1|nr:IS256 family transposase [Sedimentisphaerales bacterium]
MQNSTSASAEKNLSNIIKIDEGQIQQHLGEMVRSTVEETLNTMLDVEADQLCNARRYEHTEGRTAQRAGHYTRKLHTKAGEVELKVPKLRQAKFETAIIERYKRRESSVEEALMEMYLAGVSVRRVEDITEALWGMRVSAGTVSDLNQKMYERIETWRNRPITGVYPYVYLDGISLKRTWGGEVRNVAVLVAIGVGEDGYRDILGIAEGCKEDKAGWSSFLAYLKRRGLQRPELIISDKCLGLLESLGEYYPEAQWQRCMVHFYRNVFSVVPKGKVKQVAAMLKAIHAQEDRPASQEKADAVVAKLKALKLPAAAELVREGIGETLTYYAFPDKHHRQIRTNNPLERIMREIRRRSRVVGSFPDGQSALMLAAARLRYIAGTKWGTRRYMNMDRLKELQQERQEAARVSA